jgi:trans-aconitate 2-methyltransferase
MSLARPGLSFCQGRIEELEGSYDLVFSHAAVQWVEDHEALIPRLLSHVRPGGQLAVQMPANHDHPTHMAIRYTASEKRFREALRGFSRESPVLPVRRYAELLFACGVREQVVFQKVYPHVLEDAAAMVEWVRGTAMVPYLERLSPNMQEAFMERCRQRVRKLFPGSPVLYGFCRNLLWAGL